MNDELSLYQLLNYTYQRKLIVFSLSITGFILVIAITLMKDNPVTYTTAIEIGSYYEDVDGIRVRTYLESIDSLSTKINKIYIPMASQSGPASRSVPIKVDVENNSPILVLSSPAIQSARDSVVSIHTQVLESIIREHKKIIDSLSKFRQINISQALAKLNYLNNDSITTSRLNNTHQKIDKIKNNLGKLKINRELDTRKLSTEKAQLLSRIANADTRLVSLESKLVSLNRTKEIIGEQIASTEKKQAALFSTTGDMASKKQAPDESLAMLFISNRLLDQEKLLWELRNKHSSTIDHEMRKIESDILITKNDKSAALVKLKEVDNRLISINESFSLDESALQSKIIQLENELKKTKAEISLEIEDITSNISKQKTYVEEIRPTKALYVGYENKNSQAKRTAIFSLFGAFAGFTIAMIIIFIEYTHKTTKNGAAE